jgi:ribose/xylose/arabinose/galactoside ABC-type transport system permease subunit
LVAVLWLGAKFPDFRTGGNFGVVLSRVADIGVVAAGMTLVIATGGIDISVGSVVGFCGIVLGVLCVNAHWSLGPAIIAAIAAGAGCGLINGLLVSRFKVPPIIATLAMFSAARAGAYVLSKNQSNSGIPEARTDFGYGSWPTITLPGGDTLAVPKAFWIVFIVLAASAILLKQTNFGRGLLALGGNREASYLSGLRIRRTESVVYVISGLLAGLQAVMVTSKATSDPNAGQYFELSAITAVVLGGTSVQGGQATVVGTGLGVFTIAVIYSGVQMYKQEPMVAMLVTALALLASVEVDRLRRRGFGRRRSRE